MENLFVKVCKQIDKITSKNLCISLASYVCYFIQKYRITFTVFICKPSKQATVLNVK